MTRILCLWFPHWPLERLLAAQPELQGRRVLIYEQTPQGGLRVVACSDPSARPGMPLAEALGMVQGSVVPRSARPITSRSDVPQSAIHLECHDPWADRQTLIDVAEACRRYSPTVGIEDAPQPQCLFLDLTGLAPLFRSEESLIQQVIGMIRSRGYTPRFAVAETMGAAWGLAHFELRIADCGLPIEDSKSAISPLPIAALRLPLDMLALLSRLGLHRVGQVEALPRDALASRFGPQLLLRLDQMFGRAAETLAAPRTTADIVAEYCFEAPIEQQETIDATCYELVRQIAAPLAARQEGAVQLECRFDQPPHGPARLAVGLFRPSSSAKHLWQLLRLRLETLRLAAGVTAVRLEVLARAPLAWQQQELFDMDRRVDAARQTALLIDRLSNRLGRQAVVRPVLLSDAQPEHACLDLPLAGEAAPRAASPPSRAAKRTRHSSLRHSRFSTIPAVDERPLFLKRQPLPLQQVRQARSGAPRAFRLAGREHRLARVAGPERIETGWWRTGLVRRDYYRVETTAGSRYWLFFDLRGNRWFLHGEFG